MIFISENGTHVKIDPWYDESEFWATQAVYDKLDELYGRIRELEGDIEFYLSGIGRDW